MHIAAASSHSHSTLNLTLPPPTGGRPDVMQLVKDTYRSWGAEVVFITSNWAGNKEIMEGCKAAGIPAVVSLCPSFSLANSMRAAVTRLSPLLRHRARYGISERPRISSFSLDPSQRSGGLSLGAAAWGIFGAWRATRIRPRPSAGGFFLGPFTLAA